MSDGDERVPVGRVETGSGKYESPGEEAAGDGDNADDEGQAGHVDGFGGEEYEPAWHGGEADADHAGAVFLGDGQDGKHGNDGLADVDSAEGELGWVGAAGCLVGGGRDRGAHPGGQRDGADEQPDGAGQGAELGPLGLYRLGHASRRRSARVAMANAMAV